MRLLISGASKGIGRATAIAALEEGHEVLALARNEEALQSLAEGWDTLHPFPLDLMGANLENRIREGMERNGFRDLDGVIHAAGHLAPKRFVEQEEEDWERTLRANLIGPACSLKALHPYLIRGKAPHVVLIGSMAGYAGSKKFPGLSAYGASKAGLAALGEALAEEWEEDGVRVNCLALGAVDTEMFQSAFPEGHAPLGPEEVGGYVWSFFKEGGRVMNGKQVPVSLSTP